MNFILQSTALKSFAGLGWNLLVLQIEISCKWFEVFCMDSFKNVQY